MPSRHAPAVSYALGRSRFLAALLGLVWLLGLAVTLAWWQVAAGHPGPWLGAVAVLLAGLVAVQGWWRQPLGRLSWDGQRWAWQDARAPAGVPLWPQPVLDLQRMLLIRLQGAAGVPQWVWADAATEPGRWLDFRRALFAQGGPSADRPDAPGRDAPP